MNNQFHKNYQKFVLFIQISFIFLAIIVQFNLKLLKRYWLLWGHNHYIDYEDIFKKISFLSFFYVKWKHMDLLYIILETILKQRYPYILGYIIISWIVSANRVLIFLLLHKKTLKIAKYNIKTNTSSQQHILFGIT